MKKRELRQRIVDLERRVAGLEAAKPWESAPAVPQFAPWIVTCSCGTSARCYMHNPLQYWEKVTGASTAYVNAADLAGVQMTYTVHNLTH